MACQGRFAMLDLRSTSPGGLASYNLDRSVIVAVIPMYMVQAAVDQIIGVVAVGYCFVATGRAVLVSGGMSVTRAVAYVRVGRVHVQAMFVNMVFVNVMQMSVMDVVNVPVMADCRVPTADSVLM